MVFPMITTAVALFYVGAIPVKLAFHLHLGEEFRFGIGVSIFEERFARNLALRRESMPKKLPAFLKKLNLSTALRSALRAARHMLAHTRLDFFQLHGSLGTHDAALTALVCGVLMSMGCALRCASGRSIRLNLRPDFSSDRLRADLTGMISVRIGHIMLAALLGAFEYLTGRIRQWTSIPLKAS